MSVNARIAETITLPSRGLIYEEEVNPDIILGSMKAKHEMMRLSATPTNSNKIMCDIIDDCIQGDCGISSYDMCLGDYQFLLYKLRIVTYGPEYKMEGTCPNCGAPDLINVNLDELEVHSYDEELIDNLSLHLPKTNADVQLTLQTPRILDKINRTALDNQRKHKSAYNNGFVNNIVNSIEKLDGEIPNSIMLEEWVKDLPMSDTNLLLNRIDKINASIGVQLDIGYSCPKCSKYSVIPFRITREFFRPSN